MNVQILCTTLNSMKTLPRMIESIERFMSLKECLVVDGGSTDGTIEFLEKRKVKVVTLMGSSIYEALEYGIGLVSSDFTYILGSDDYFVKPIPKLDSAVSLYRFNVYLDSNSVITNQKSFKYYYRRHCYALPWFHQSVIVRTADLKVLLKERKVNYSIHRDMYWISALVRSNFTDIVESNEAFVVYSTEGFSRLSYNGIRSSFNEQFCIFEDTSSRKETLYIWMFKLLLRLIYENSCNRFFRFYR